MFKTQNQQNSYILNWQQAAYKKTHLHRFFTVYSGIILDLNENSKFLK